jgi:hypothetical protein
MKVRKTIKRVEWQIERAQLTQQDNLGKNRRIKTIKNQEEFLHQNLNLLQGRKINKNKLSHNLFKIQFKEH